MTAKRWELLKALCGAGPVSIREAARRVHVAGSMRRIERLLAQSQADIAAGRYVIESAQQHLERVEAMLAADGAGVPAKKALLGKVPLKKTATRKVVRRSPGK